MDKSHRDLGHYLGLLRRQAALIVVVTMLGTLLAMLFALSLDPVYRSTATILIEEPEVPSDLVESTISGYAAQRIQSIERRVMTTPKITAVIEKLGLYREDRATTQAEILAARFRDASGLDPVTTEVVDPRNGRPTVATIAFNVHFDHQEPRVAQQVANELVSLYLAENLIERQSRAAETTEFLKQESDRLGAAIKRMETDIAAFKSQNAGRLPEEALLNGSALERISRDSAETARRIQSLLEQRSQLTAELTGVSPFLAFSRDGTQLLSPNERLQVALAKYASLKGVYTEEHPDMQALSREIEALSGTAPAGVGLEDLRREEAQLSADLTAARERYAADHPEVARLERRLAAVRANLADGSIIAPRASAPQARPNNPVFVQIQSRINALEIELASLNRQLASLEENRVALEQRIQEMPEVERQYRLLIRDYENAQLRYNEVKAKELQAELSQSLETDRKSERFTLIEPPLVPSDPIRPNRRVLMLFGFLASLSAAAGLVLARDGLDQSIRSAKQLSAITGEEPLVIIPHIYAEGDAQGLRRLLVKSGKSLGLAASRMRRNPAAAT